MSTLHYFQRYSQKENWLTNSTLLLLRHFYLHDHKKFEQFVNDLDPQIEVQVGPVFRQQIRGKSSVPDGSIVQKPFNILIEAKRGGGLDEKQLLGHSFEFQRGEDNILIAFTKEKIKDNRQERLTQKIQESISSEVSAQVVFLTYEEIYNGINKFLKEYDLEMVELLEDYAAMCEREGVFEKRSHTMMAVSCGRSYKENLAYNIYYDPVDRNHNIPFSYMGIYKDKAIRHIGKIEKIVACDMIESELINTHDNYQKNFDSLTSDEIERIKGIIKATDVYNLKKGKKFFILSELKETSFNKTDKSAAIQSKRYFNLNEFDGFEKGMSAGEVAELLNGREW